MLAEAYTFRPASLLSLSVDGDRSAQGQDLNQSDDVAVPHADTPVAAPPADRRRVVRSVQADDPAEFPRLQHLGIAREPVGVRPVQGAGIGELDQRREVVLAL